MFPIDHLILLGAILILLGILSSKLSARLGLPVLVLFLLVGMLAGEDGVGIAFDNPEAAHALGTLALALILFDGGLQTPLESITRVWKPASLLATLGVLVTATVTGLVATLVLDLSVLEGLLLGAIVGSTDAAAVFSLFRNAGVNINSRLKSTLEIESASNDPMAIFLTVGLLDVLVNDKQPGLGLLQLFVMQMGIGAATGLAIGWLAVKMVNRVRLTASGLYLVMMTALGLLAFGIAANLGGSGFLAIFIAGVMIGNKRFVFQRSTFLFHDGLAWLSQITMFVVLGLLVNPESLLDIWPQGLVIAAVLVLLARPLAVAPVLHFFGFNRREIGLVSWVGLRGSVPIILAIFPLLFGLPGAELIFNVVFFVVLISATIQGSTMPWVARRLGLMEPVAEASTVALEITSLGEVDAEIVEYTLADPSRVDGRPLSRMALPDGCIVAMISRSGTVMPPRGSTRLQSGDHLFVVMRPEQRPLVDAVFAPAAVPAEEILAQGRRLCLKGTTRVRDLLEVYGIDLKVPPALTLDQVMREQLDTAPVLDMTREVAGIQLRVVDLLEGRITTVELSRPVVNAVSTDQGRGPRL